MRNIPSLLRIEEHRALSRITLQGNVLDLGGDKNSEYLTYVQGTFKTTTVNFDKKARPDVVHDLEKPLPFEDSSYDWVVLCNALEHVFEYRALLQEAARVARSGGGLVVVVPFLFPLHPSPEDYHRFTASTLRREMEHLGLKDIRVVPLGKGLFSARYLLLDRLLPRSFRFINFYTGRYIAYSLDTLYAGVARLVGKRYTPADYALGYCATAKK